MQTHTYKTHGEDKCLVIVTVGTPESGTTRFHSKLCIDLVQLLHPRLLDARMRWRWSPRWN